MIRISIIGMGYIGLPLAIEFSKYYEVTGYDTDKKKIKNLINNIDKTKETKEKLLKNSRINFTSNSTALMNSNIYIVTVPTPLYKNKKPNLTPLKKACLTISKFLNKKDIVIFESTVFPGATEEICVPILESKNKLIFNKDFFCGYSPERINPGDKKNNLTTIKKITSGSNDKTSKFVDNLYKKIIKAGTFRTKSIKIAETAKVIENCQRDLNIAFMNDITMLLNKMNINIYDVLDAAKTKWNFLNFYPGLVGGHCVAVDPYYLYQKGIDVGHESTIIKASRKINDSMPSFVVKDVENKINEKKLKNKNKINILILGITFKENCNDTRNSLVPEIYSKLSKKNNVYVYDPLVEDSYFNLKKIYFIRQFKNNTYDVIILAVPHKSILDLWSVILKKCSKKNSLIYDIKGIYRNKNNTESF